jgi:hypothetical protein
VATYYDIFGQKVQYLSSDPSPVTEGQVWYNSSTNLAKVQVSATAAWTTQGVYPQAVRDAFGFGASSTAALVAGGANPGIGGRKSDAFSYNGSAWTTLTSVPTPLNGLDADGPISAGITAGGNTPGSPVATNTSSFDYNGSSWTANPTLPVSRSGHAVVGNTAAQSAAIAVSGESAPTSHTSRS